MGKYCGNCGHEKPRNGMTMYSGKKVCECKEEKDLRERLYNIFIEIRNLKTMKKGKMDNNKWYKSLIEELQVLEYNTFA